MAVVYAFSFLEPNLKLSQPVFCFLLFPDKPQRTCFCNWGGDNEVQSYYFLVLGLSWLMAPRLVKYSLCGPSPICNSSQGKQWPNCHQIIIDDRNGLAKSGRDKEVLEALSARQGQQAVSMGRDWHKDVWFCSTRQSAWVDEAEPTSICPAEMRYLTANLRGVFVDHSGYFPKSVPAAWAKHVIQVETGCNETRINLPNQNKSQKWGDWEIISKYNNFSGSDSSLKLVLHLVLVLWSSTTQPTRGRSCFGSFVRNF